MHLLLQPGIKASLYFYKSRQRASPVQNFYCQKPIWLQNSFEFIWNLKENFEIWKFDLNLRKNYPVGNLFQMWSSQSCSMCAYLTLSRDKLEYTHKVPLRRFYVWTRIKIFQIEMKFGISNKFKWIFRR